MNARVGTGCIAAAHELCYEDFAAMVDEADLAELRDVLPACAPAD